MRSLLALLLAVTAGTSVGLPTPENGCKSGSMYGTYFPDCEYFVQCDKNLTTVVMPCAFGTYWNENKMACTVPDEVACTNDKCGLKPDGDRRGDDRNCRGYWECENGRSQPQCCPFGQRFDANIMDCIDVGLNESECNTTCLGDPQMFNGTLNDTLIDINPISIVRECALKTVKDNPNAYYQFLPGFPEPIERPCADGTRFDELQCGCVGVSTTYVCKPDIHLTMESGEIVDHSGNGHYRYVYNVEMESDGAVFNGINSSIVFPRFHNIDHVKDMFIRITYKSDDMGSVFQWGILSNDLCDGMPSVKIEENDENVLFSVGTTDMEEGQMATLAVSQPTDHSTMKTVQYMFHANQLTGAVNDLSEAIGVGEYISNVQCELTIGASSDAGYFKGKIQELEIYLCDPESAPSPQ